MTCPRPIPEGIDLRLDGRPVTEGSVDRILSLPDVLAEEERLVALAERRVATSGYDHAVAGIEDLDAPQRALAEAVAGERLLVLAVGPAGTGKTSALQPAVDQTVEGRSGRLRRGSVGHRRRGPGRRCRRRGRHDREAAGGARPGPPARSPL